MNNSVTQTNGHASVKQLYIEADTLVGSEPGTLLISGNAADLALIEKVLRRLQVVKTKSGFRKVLEAALQDESDEVVQ